MIHFIITGKVYTERRIKAQLDEQKTSKHFKLKSAT